MPEFDFTLAVKDPAPKPPGPERDPCKKCKHLRNAHTGLNTCCVQYTSTEGVGRLCLCPHFRESK